MVCCYSVTERRSFLIWGLHPEAHGETWHTPDVGFTQLCHERSRISGMPSPRCRWSKNVRTRFAQNHSLVELVSFSYNDNFQRLKKKIEYFNLSLVVTFLLSKKAITSSNSFVMEQGTSWFININFFLILHAHLDEIMNTKSIFLQFKLGRSNSS